VPFPEGDGEGIAKTLDRLDREYMVYELDSISDGVGDLAMGGGDGAWFA
jgi:hypothetical protein